MATSLQSFVQDQMADVTECSICTEVYTNPKILPCVHTFCLECLEKYGKDKKAGDQMACPICRNEFLIPDRGFGSLPNNFFICKMVEIRKLTETPTDEALCGTCPEEERVKAKLFCFECEQNLCERCGVTHSKMKLSQNHQVVQIGSNLKTQEVNCRNSYCDQHPGEIVKMYCEDDKATICFLCFAESHQAHKCLSVTKASEEFSSALKNHLKTVLGRLSEFQTSLQKCDKWRDDFLTQIVGAERQILEEAVRLKALIDIHANILTHKLTALKVERLKEIDSMKEDLDRFKVTFKSYARYSDELLSKGSPGDICREANQLKARARELALLNTVRDCNRSGLLFKSLKLEDVLHVNNIANVIGDVQSDHPVPIPTQKDVVLDATLSHQLSESTTVKMNPHTLASENTESEITGSMTFTFDASAMYFIQSRRKFKKHIEDSLENLNCRVEWPSEGKEEMHLEYKSKENQKMLRGWDAECTKFLQRYKDELTWKKVNILQEIWNEFKTEIQEQLAQKSKLLVDYVNDVCEIHYIGLEKNTCHCSKQ